MNYNDLSDDLKRKVREAGSTAELLALAREEGIELSDEELEGVAGGVDWDCPAYGHETPTPSLPEG